MESYSDDDKAENEDKEGDENFLRDLFGLGKCIGNIIICTLIIEHLYIRKVCVFDFPRKDFFYFHDYNLISKSWLGKIGLFLFNAP